MKVGSKFDKALYIHDKALYIHDITYTYTYTYTCHHRSDSRRIGTSRELMDSNVTEYELIFQVLHSTYPVHRNGEGRGNDVRQKQVKV